MNNKNIRYSIHEISGAGFVVWDELHSRPITGMYAMSEMNARKTCAEFNRLEEERVERLARLNNQDRRSA